MLPQQTLSTAPTPSGFLPPRNARKELLLDYEQGGAAIQDASQGLQVKTWRGEVIGNDVVLSAENVAPTVVFTQGGITEMQFTFDQNMQPFVAYMLNDTDARFRWFDATVPGFVVTSLPSGSYSPRCALDDKRNAAGTILGASDIILTYLRGGTLYFRAQRDRYETEYLLKTGLADYRLGQFGMSRQWRMQWQLFKPVVNS
jgi:hypothetical protein